MKERAEIPLSDADSGTPAMLRRRPVLVTGMSVFVGAVVCAGGLALMTAQEEPDRKRSESVVTPMPIPMLVSADDVRVSEKDQNLDDRMKKAAKRLSDAIGAGEQVYEAARASSSPAPALARLRAALDQATVVLDRELGSDATSAERRARVAALDEQRGRILDASARLTEVRSVPADELPEGTSTVVAEPPGSSPVQPPQEPGTGGTTPGDPGGDIAPGTGSTDPGGTDPGDGGGSSGGGSTGGGGSGGSGGGTGEPTRTPTPTPEPDPTPTRPDPEPTTPPAPGSPTPTPTS